MSDFVRRAGRGTDAGGALVVWSVAEGRRGRRWREVRTEPDTRESIVVLLETEPGDRFSHTELGTGVGLLTLHPDGDALHGNVVTASGIEHVAGLAWAADSLLVIERSTVSASANAHALRKDVEVGASVSRPAVFVDAALAVRAGDVSIERTGEDTWRIGGMEIAVDDDGLPLLFGARIWPLESE